MGATHFLTRTMPKVATEMALSVLAYNFTHRSHSAKTPSRIAANDRLLLNQLALWASVPGTRKKILVDNPAQLYQL